MEIDFEPAVVLMYFECSSIQSLDVVASPDCMCWRMDHSFAFVVVNNLLEPSPPHHHLDSDMSPKSVPDLCIPCTLEKLGSIVEPSLLIG